MANYLFDGSQNLTISNFNTISDTITFVNVNAVNVRSFEQVNGGTQLVLNNGRVLSLTNTPLGTLTAGNLVRGAASDLVFSIGTAGVDAAQTGNVIVGFAGGDTQTASSNGAIIYGNSDNDTINGTAGGTTYLNLRLYGGQGNDSITGFGQGSVVYGGLNTLGVDVITAGTIAVGATTGVTVYGGNGFSDAGDGDDSITGSTANDLIYGNGGNDTIAASGGADSIYGGQGNDSITGVGDGSVVYGGLNNDTIDASGASAGVTIFGGNGFNDASDGADSIVGSTGNDLIYGNGGSDFIDANGGRDSIYGGSGNDTVTGGIDNGTVVYGGNGSDSIDVTGTGGTVSIFGGNGFSDTGDGADTIIFSGTGSVLAYGNGGADNIRTAGGNDTIFGGAGADTIDAGAGINVVTGGADADVFVATGNPVPGPAVTPSNTNYTTVTDFGGGDTIQFSGAVRGITQLAINTTITDVDGFIAATATSTADAGQAYQFTFTAGAMAGTTIIGYDRDAGIVAGGVDEVIVLTGTVATLNGSAFTVG